MRKFIVHTRAIPGRPKEESPFYLLEVEVEIITALEDPSILFLPVGEFRFKIMEPKFLNDFSGPSIYYSHSIYADSVIARDVAKRMVVEELEFSKRKYKIDYSQEDVENKISKIEEVLL